MRSPSNGKPKLSVYWASGCGGCEIALVNVHEKLLEVERHFDFFFCPCLLDTKVDAVEALPDGAIAVTLFNGAIRTEENVEMARLLRRKSQVLVAYGACAVSGSIPALANLGGRDAQLRAIFLDAPSTDNPERIVPRGIEGMELPPWLGRVGCLRDVVEVDYAIPGCPPESRQVWSVVETLIAGGPLPPKGSVLGAGDSAVCVECSRERSDKRIARFVRPHEIVPEDGKCLLDQGIVCMGPATRNGCGALCPQVNMPCTGCYGAPPTVVDQGAKMIAALGSALEIGDYKGMTEEELAGRSEAAARQIVDPAGTFYRYAMTGAPVGRRDP